MKVLFVLTTVGSKCKFHHGIACLSGTLEHVGHQTDFIELRRVDYNALDEIVRRFQPDVVATTAVQQQFPYAKDVIEYIARAYPHIRTVLGGIHPILVPECITEVDGLDAVCITEGEGPLLNFVDALEAGREPYDLPNFYFRRDGEIIRNLPSYFVSDISGLPFPNYDLFPVYRQASPNELLPVRPRIIFNRGCPYNCSYCANIALKEAFPGKKYVRYMTPERAVELLLHLSKRYRFDEYVIDDDVFTLNKRWLLRFCELYPDELKSKRFEVNVRVETIDEEGMRALKDINCSLLKVGLESGDFELRKKVLNRNITDEMLIEMFDLAHRVGIKAHTFNMVGVPGETVKKIRKTIRLNRRLRPDRVQISIFYPYMGTPLGAAAFKQGLVTGDADSYFTTSALTLEGLTKTQIDFYAKYFKLMVYSAYSWTQTWEQIRLLSNGFSLQRIFFSTVAWLTKRLGMYPFAKRVAVHLGVSPQQRSSAVFVLPVETMGGSDGADYD